MSHAKGTRETTRNVLTLKETLILQKIVAEEYAKSEMNNVTFAGLVNTTHTTAFRGPLTATHISTMLDALDIPNNHAVIKRGEDCQLLTARVAALEEQLAKLAMYVKSLR